MHDSAGSIFYGMGGLVRNARFFCAARLCRCHLPDSKRRRRNGIACRPSNLGRFLQYIRRAVRSHCRAKRRMEETLMRSILAAGVIALLGAIAAFAQTPGARL